LSVLKIILLLLYYILSVLNKLLNNNINNINYIQIQNAVILAWIKYYFISSCRSTRVWRSIWTTRSRRSTRPWWDAGKIWLGLRMQTSQILRCRL